MVGFEATVSGMEHLTFLRSNSTDKKCGVRHLVVGKPMLLCVEQRSSVGKKPDWSVCRNQLLTRHGDGFSVASLHRSSPNRPSTNSVPGGACKGE